MHVNYNIAQGMMQVNKGLNTHFKKSSLPRRQTSVLEPWLWDLGFVRATYDEWDQNSKVFPSLML